MEQITQHINRRLKEWNQGKIYPSLIEGCVLCCLILSHKKPFPILGILNRLQLSFNLVWLFASGNWGTRFIATKVCKLEAVALFRHHLRGVGMHEAGCMRMWQPALLAPTCACILNACLGHESIHMTNKDAEQSLDEMRQLVCMTIHHCEQPHTHYKVIYI